MWVERWDRLRNDQKTMLQEKYYKVNNGHKFHQNPNYRRHRMGKEKRKISWQRWGWGKAPEEWEGLE